MTMKGVFLFTATCMTMKKHLEQRGARHGARLCHRQGRERADEGLFRCEDQRVRAHTRTHGYIDLPISRGLFFSQTPL